MNSTATAVRITPSNRVTTLMPVAPRTSRIGSAARSASHNDQNAARHSKRRDINAKKTQQRFRDENRGGQHNRHRERRHVGNAFPVGRRMMLREINEYGHRADWICDYE